MERQGGNAYEKTEGRYEDRRGFHCTQDTSILGVRMPRWQREASFFSTPQLYIAWFRAPTFSSRYLLRAKACIDPEESTTRGSWMEAAPPSMFLGIPAEAIAWPIGSI
jgi:hypothetical protein